MFLIRHNQLMAPYDSYENLSLSQLDDLATHKIDPPIQKFDITPFQEVFTDSAMMVVCSEAARTQQTYQLVKHCFDGKAEEIDADLNEIYFSPRLLIQGPSLNPLADVRKNFYTWILDKAEGMESCDALEKRVQRIFKKYQNRNVACFSHGFLIRLMKSYQKQNHDFNAALIHINEIQAIDYLEITELNI